MAYGASGDRSLEFVLLSRLRGNCVLLASDFWQIVSQGVAWIRAPRRA